jgi:hypothetical protein
MESTLEIVDFLTVVLFGFLIQRGIPSSKPIASQKMNHNINALVIICLRYITVNTIKKKKIIHSARGYACGLSIL